MTQTSGHFAMTLVQEFMEWVVANYPGCDMPNPPDDWDPDTEMYIKSDPHTNIQHGPIKRSDIPKKFHALGRR